MPAKKLSQILEKDLPVSFTEKPVTPFGGLALVARYFRKIGLAQMLASVLPDEKKSNNSISSVSIVMSFLIEVLRGANRFAHVAWLRFDAPLKSAFGIRKAPSGSVVTRYFRTFRRVHIEALCNAGNRILMPLLKHRKWGHTLDLDSTVFVRYGKQEGSAKGYNPKKPGRNSHHPIMAFLAEARMILHVWLRSGNTHTARGVVAFFREAIEMLRAYGHRIYAVRADSGFGQDDFLTELERLGIPYAVATRFTNRVKYIIGHTVRDWRTFGPGLEVGETTYQALEWKRPRRLVVVRELVVERPDARGRKLFDIPGYTFHAIVTTLDWKPEIVWRFYNGRADSENRIKEVAEHYGAKGFCVKNFYGTEAALRLICLLYNLMAIFKQEVLKRPELMINRLRTEIFAVGGILGMERGRPTLRLSLKDHLKDRFLTFLHRLDDYIPTASQFNLSEGKT